MNFIQRKINSIYLRDQDISDMGLKVLPSYAEDCTKTNVEFSVVWIGGFHENCCFEIKSKSGKTIKGCGSSILSKDHMSWKIPPNNYELLENFIIGFKVHLGLSIVRFRQIFNEVRVDIIDENKSIELSEVSLDDLQERDQRLDEFTFIERIKYLFEEGEPFTYSENKRLNIPWRKGCFTIKYPLTQEQSLMLVGNTIKEESDRPYFSQMMSNSGLIKN